MKFPLFVHIERVSADAPQRRLYHEMIELCEIADQNAMPAIWHPINLAGEAAMAVPVSGGRRELGIAHGAHAFECDRLVPGRNVWSAGQKIP